MVGRKSMPGIFRNVTIQLVADDTSPIEESVAKKSFFLQHAFKLREDMVVAPAAPELVKDESLGHLWSDVSARNGQYVFEIATSLPFFLPSLRGKPEYSICVRDSELVVSSRMVQCYFTSEKHTPLKYFLAHRFAVQAVREKWHLEGLHPVPLRTFISKRFATVGDDAEQLIQSKLYEWVSEFTVDVSHLVDAVRCADPEQAESYPLLPPLSLFWLVVQGEGQSGKDLALAQFALDLRDTGFRSVSNFEEQKAKTLEDFASSVGPIPVPEGSLSLAKALERHGRLGLALLEVCTACEAVLAQAYRQFLIERGVSKKKYREVEQDITYSQLLNLHLATMFDLAKLPTEMTSALARLNWARSRRNEYVHDGQFKKDVDRDLVREAISAAENLVSFVRSERMEKGNP
jgi:hypothetical protein